MSAHPQDGEQMAPEMPTSPGDAAATAPGLINQSNPKGTTIMTTTDALIFEEPPSSKGRGSTGSWATRLAPLREHPGRWARLPGTFNSAIASHIKTGQFSGLEAGEFDATCRKADAAQAHRFHIYVRYIGHLKAADSAAS